MKIKESIKEIMEIPNILRKILEELKDFHKNFDRYRQNLNQVEICRN